MTQPKPLTPISIEKVDFSKLDKTTFYVGLVRNGHLDSFSGGFLVENPKWITHIYLEQSEESKWISVFPVNPYPTEKTMVILEGTYYPKDGFYINGTKINPEKYQIATPFLEDKKGQEK
jgi:hypothetical protein